MNWKHLATAAWLATLTFACDDAALSAEDWLRWNDERGFPSITFNSSGLHVTLPEGLLAEAIALGKSREQAVVSFLNRYAPGMCTDMSDMQVSHTGLSVHVRLQRELEEFLPHHAFVVDDAEQDFVVNYAPKKPGHCIDPDASS
jgi:hypothetical protein